MGIALDQDGSTDTSLTHRLARGMRHWFAANISLLLDVFLCVLVSAVSMLQWAKQLHGEQEDGIFRLHKLIASSPSSWDAMLDAVPWPMRG